MIGFNLSRKRIAVFPTVQVRRIMLGIDVNYIEGGGVIIASDGTTWSGWGESTSIERFGGYFEKYARDVFDYLINEYVPGCEKKVGVVHDKPVNGLKTGVEKYYLVIDWDAVEDYGNFRREVVRRLSEMNYQTEGYDEEQKSDDD
ncbi:hypothetical protein ACJMK2_027184 [Sinanodonta woodiana]|uniref:Uncharacterized protein n=1 Tax=Sinanodonta woodiana TaxID=1069815 RepID=A0ABD3XLW4_SINWO